MCTQEKENKTMLILVPCQVIFSRKEKYTKKDTGEVKFKYVIGFLNRDLNEKESVAEVTIWNYPADGPECCKDDHIQLIGDLMGERVFYQGFQMEEGE